MFGSTHAIHTPHSEPSFGGGSRVLEEAVGRLDRSWMEAVCEQEFAVGTLVDVWGEQPGMTAG